MTSKREASAQRQTSESSIELTINLEMDTRHNAVASKDRNALFMGKPAFVPDESTGPPPTAAGMTWLPIATNSKIAAIVAQLVITWLLAMRTALLLMPFTVRSTSCPRE